MSETLLLQRDYSKILKMTSQSIFRRTAIFKYVVYLSCSFKYLSPYLNCDDSVNKFIY